MKNTGSTAEKSAKYSCFPELSHENLRSIADCISACETCSKLCIQEGHKNTAIICSECAAVCTLAYKFHSCQSEFSQQVMELCEEVCRRCAEECSRMLAKHCKECAEICQKCVAACNNISSNPLA